MSGDAPRELADRTSDSRLAEPGTLLEREREVAALERLLGAVAAGRPAVGLVKGAAGIGQSQLLARALVHAGAIGVRVLRARAGEMERDVPFGVARQLFEPAVARATGTLLAGAAAPARGVFDLTADPNRDADPSFAATHGLYWLTMNVAAGRPLALVVDDLHWCDRSSMRFLAYLVRRLDGLPVLLLLSVRPADPGTDAALLDEIVGDPLTETIAPGPLSEQSATVLVRERLGDGASPAFVAACHTATGGNPLLLGELLKAVVDEGVTAEGAHAALLADLGPASVSRSVLLRLRRLSRDAIALANAVAVLGDGADLHTVAELAGLTTDAASVAVSALVRAEILSAGPTGSFVHPVVGAAVYGDLPPLVRAVHHERVAALLTARGASAERIAVHLRHSPPRGDPATVRTLLRAARSAQQRGAAETAVDLLDRANREPPPPEQRVGVLLELGRAESRTSGPRAVEHLTAAYAALDDPVARATTAQVLARALLFTGRPDEGAAVARAAAAEVPPGHDDARLALEAFECFAVLFGAGDPETLHRLRSRRTLPVGAGIGAKMLAAIAAQDWVYEGGPSDRCCELSLAALAGGELLAADNGLFGTCAITNLVFADRPEAMDRWDEARADAHGGGSLFAISSFDLWYGYTLLRRGDLADAESSLRSALEEFRLWGYGRDQAQLYCDAFLAAVLIERGELGAARTTLDGSIAPDGDDDGARYWLNSNVELQLAERRFDVAATTAREYGRRFSALIRNPMDAPWRSHMTVALHGLGRGSEARDLAQEELDLARGWGAPSTVARSLRALALVVPERGTALLSEAVDAVAGTPARLEAAKSYLALGRALRHAGRPRDAREPLKRAVELAVACGAAPVAADARTELATVGGRPRATAVTGIDALTASERRVAALAADGAANREIAQALYVTPKTVEAHLGSVYRKLGIRSRRELWRCWPSLSASDSR